MKVTFGRRSRVLVAAWLVCLMLGIAYSASQLVEPAAAFACCSLGEQCGQGDVCCKPGCWLDCSLEKKGYCVRPAECINCGD